MIPVIETFLNIFVMCLAALMVGGTLAIFIYFTKELLS